MICNNCNCNVPDGNRYCPNCGSPLRVAPPTQITNPSQRNGMSDGMAPGTQIVTPSQKSANHTALYILLGMLITAVIVLVAFLIFGRDSSAKVSDSDNTVTDTEEATVIDEPAAPQLDDRESQYDWLSERKVTTADLAGKPAGELRIMRNAIMAKHGYIFKSQDLAEYFSGFSWYKPLYNDVTSMLSAVEAANVQFIKKYEGGTTSSTTSASSNSRRTSIGYTGDFSDIACYTRLTDEDVYDLTKEQLRILRNTIYARHGRIFKDAKLRDYFSGFSWYEPRYKEINLNSLSDIEKHNITLIQKYE